MGLSSQGSMLLYKMDPRLWGNNGSVRERGSSFGGTTWGKGISFIHRMEIFFQVFIQYATYHPYNANAFKSPFHPFFATFFSICTVKCCIMYTKITKWMNYCAHFTEFALNNLVKGNTSPPFSGKL